MFTLLGLTGMITGTLLHWDAYENTPDMSMGILKIYCSVILFVAGFISFCHGVSSLAVLIK